MEYGDLTGMSATELAATRRKLAKRANQRLLRLERSTSPVTGKAYHAGAYDIALEYLRETGRGRRFSESINYLKIKDEETGETAYNIYRLKREILELDTFLHSKTSTISGNKAVEKKRIETFTGTDWGLDEATVSSKEFYDFLQSNIYDYYLKNSFTSEQLVDLYSIYRSKGAKDKDIIEGLEELKKNNQERNAKDTTGKIGEISIKDTIEALNDATGQELTLSDVLIIRDNED